MSQPDSSGPDNSFQLSPSKRFEYRLVEDIWVLIPVSGITNTFLPLSRDIVTVLLLRVPLEEHSTVFGYYENGEGQMTLFQGLKRKGSEWVVVVGRLYKVTKQCCSKLLSSVHDDRERFFVSNCVTFFDIDTFLIYLILF